MIDVDAQHALEVAAVEYQQPVQILGARGSDEALRDPVRFRSANRHLHAPDAFAAEVEAEVGLTAATRATADSLATGSPPKALDCTRVNVTAAPSATSSSWTSSCR